MGQRATPNTSATTASGAPTTDGRSPSLWFGAPSDDPDRRPQLTRQRVVAEALAVIALRVTTRIRKIRNRRS